MTLIHIDRPRAFTPRECDAIIAMAPPAALAPGHVWTGTGYAIHPSVRRVESCYLGRRAAPSWLFDRLDSLFAEAADPLGTEVGPIVEDVQVARYGAGCHYNIWHSDAGADFHDRRRLSLSIELSRLDDHDGGVLEIVPVLVGGGRSLPRGGARIFHSRALHRVTPVTRGVRYALIAWTGGPAG